MEGGCWLLLEPETEPARLLVDEARDDAAAEFFLENLALIRALRSPIPVDPAAGATFGRGLGGSQNRFSSTMAGEKCHVFSLLRTPLILSKTKARPEALAWAGPGERVTGQIANDG